MEEPKGLRPWLRLACIAVLLGGAIAGAALPAHAESAEQAQMEAPADGEEEQAGDQQEAQDEEDAKPKSRLADLAPILSGELYAGGGYDSNANTATDADRYLSFRLTEEDRESNSPFTAVGGSLAFTIPEEGRIRWSNGASYEYRNNPSAHFADSHYLSLQSLVRRSGEQFRVAAGAAASAGVIDGELANRALGVVATAETLLEVAIVGIAAEAAAWRFPDAPQRDVDSLVAEFSAERAPGSEARWLPALSIFGGTEKARQDGSPFGRTLWGASGALKYLFSPTFNLEASAGLQLSNYDGMFSPGSDERDDQRYSAAVVANWRPAEKSRWSLRSALRYVNNRSSEALYDYERGVFSLVLARLIGGES